MDQAASGAPDVKLYANNFVVGTNEIESLQSKDALDELAWKRSGASGVRMDGKTAIRSNEVIITYNAGTVTDPAQLKAGEVYKVHVHVNSTDVSSTELHLDVNMSVYDNVDTADEEGELKYLVASNDFVASESELAEGGSDYLTPVKAKVRANARALEYQYSKSGAIAVFDKSGGLNASDDGYKKNKAGATDATAMFSFALQGVADSLEVESKITVLGNGGSQTYEPDVDSGDPTLPSGNDPMDPATDDPGNIRYGMYSNDVRMSASDFNTLKSQGDALKGSLISRTGTVATKHVLGSMPTVLSNDNSDVAKDNLDAVRNFVGPGDVAVTFENIADGIHEGSKIGPTSTSTIEVYDAGSSSNVGGANVEIFANHIYASESDVPDDDIAAWLYTMAGVSGVGVDGKELPARYADSVPVSVKVDGEDPAADNAVDDATVAFEILKADKSETSVKVEVKVNLFGDGGSATVDPSDPDKPISPGSEDEGDIRYGMCSDPFRVSLDEIEDGIANDKAELIARANATATKHVLGSPLSVLGADSIEVDPGNLTAGNVGQTVDVAFENVEDGILQGNTDKSVKSTSEVAIYAHGGSESGGSGSGDYHPYAHDTTVVYNNLVNPPAGRDVTDVILEGGNAVYGGHPAAEKPVVYVKINNTFVNVASLKNDTPGFDQWMGKEYEIKVEYGNISFEAKLTVTRDSYTVKFDTNDGDPLDPSEYLVAQGTGITLPTPEREGWVFAGWYLNSDFTQFAGMGGSTFVVDKSRTVHAKWTEAEPEAAMLFYEENGGVAIADVTVAVGETVTLATPLREGWTFRGWYLDPALTQPVGMGGAQLVMDTDKTVWASWEKLPVSANFTTDHVNYITGRPQEDGTYLIAPLENVTRAEVAAMIYRLLDADVRAKYSTNVDNFPDTYEGDWYAYPVATLAAMGAIDGYPDGRFGTDQPITRAELTAIMARLSDGYVRGQMYGEIPFKDVPADHWGVSEISFAANHGWLLGDNSLGVTFRPDDTISRAETMAILNRLLNRLPHDEADLLDGRSQWPDNQDTGMRYWLTVEEATNNHDHVYVRGEHGVHEPEFDENGEQIAIDEHERWSALLPNIDWSK